MSSPIEPTVQFDFPDDAQMRRAGERSRESFRFFIRETFWEDRRLVPGLDLMLVKAAFADTPIHEDGPEFMWLDEVRFDGKFIEGVLINQPFRMTGAQEGDTIRMPLEHLIDWLISADHQAYGGFTVDVLRSRMSEPERIEHDEAWGLKFAAPGEVRFHPTEPITLRSDHPDHPIALHVSEQLDQYCLDHPDRVSTPDPSGWTMLHAYTLAGSPLCVETLLQRSADRSARTPEGLRPVDIAKTLGWNELVDLLGTDA